VLQGQNLTFIWAKVPKRKSFGEVKLALGGKDGGGVPVAGPLLAFYSAPKDTSPSLHMMNTCIT
jgi:hypothetical protein